MLSPFDPLILFLLFHSLKAHHRALLLWQERLAIPFSLPALTFNEWLGLWRYGVPRTSENFDRSNWHSMGGNEVSLVRVSFSYTRHIPFMLYTAKIFSLGSINCLKVLKEIKGKIIKISSITLTTTTLFIRN